MGHCIVVVTVGATHVGDPSVSDGVNTLLSLGYLPLRHSRGCPFDSKTTFI